MTKATKIRRNRDTGDYDVLSYGERVGSITRNLVRGRVVSYTVEVSGFAPSTTWGDFDAWDAAGSKDLVLPTARRALSWAKLDAHGKAIDLRFADWRSR